MESPGKFSHELEDALVFWVGIAPLKLIFEPDYYKAD